MLAPQGTKPVKLLMSMTGAGGADAEVKLQVMKKQTLASMDKADREV